MMRAGKLPVCASVIAILLSTVTLAAAQTAKFSSERDAVPKKYFDSNTTKPSATQPNRLIIGFNTGVDPVTLLNNQFTASPLAFNTLYVADTISFVVKAPAGFYVSAITWTQRGTSNTSTKAVQQGTTEWVVAGRPAHIGTYRSPNLTGRADLTGLKPTTVPVSVTVSMFATSTGSMSLTSADVLVELKPKS